MLRFGIEPYLECSSKGDKRFSAFYARLKCEGNKSIEELYQGSKVLEDGSINNDWRKAKGKKATNPEEIRKYYAILWNTYFKENPELLDVIGQYKGFSDIFGQEGHACQAEEIYRVDQARKAGVETVVVEI